MLGERCQIGSHKMLAVRASLAEIQEHAKDSSAYEVACINGPKDTVLSGTLRQIDSLADLLQAAGYKCFSLDVAFAFHSSQTDPILDEFEEIAKSGALFQPATLPVISPLLGKVIFDEKTFNANYMRRATRETVNFLAASWRQPTACRRSTRPWSGSRLVLILSAWALPSRFYSLWVLPCPRCGAVKTTGRRCRKAWGSCTAPALRLTGTNFIAHSRGKAVCGSWICPPTPGTTRPTGFSTTGTRAHERKHVLRRGEEGGTGRKSRRTFTQVKQHNDVHGPAYHRGDLLRVSRESGHAI